MAEALRQLWGTDDVVEFHHQSYSQKQPAKDDIVPLRGGEMSTPTTRFPASQPLELETSWHELAQIPSAETAAVLPEEVEERQVVHAAETQSEEELARAHDSQGLFAHADTSSLRDIRM